LRRSLLQFALGIFSLATALTLCMGWPGNADITYRKFDLYAFLIFGVMLIYRSLRRRGTDEEAGEA